MSTILPFGSNTLTTYIYESFSYTISNPAPGTYTLTTSNTPGIPPGYLVNNGSNVVFATTSNGMSTGVQVFTVTARDVCGTAVAVSSNTVNNNAGQFTNETGGSYTGCNFTFYKNEPLGEPYYTTIPLVAPFAISTPTAVPTLPPGLTYSNTGGPSVWAIVGTPITTVPQSNYLIIGKGIGGDAGKIVTTRFGMSVSNERIVTTQTGSTIVSPMTVGSAIAARQITARFPPYPEGGDLRYSWSGLPDGIYVTNSIDDVVTSPFTASDFLHTLNFQGTPTLAAANAYRDANITSNVVTFTATRTNPLPQISTTLPYTFAFGETVLFDTPPAPTVYTGLAIDASSISYRAQTYFSTGAPITSISSPNLRTDLSLNFVAGTGRAYLTGTPSGTTGTATYTIRATNSNAVTRDLSATITVASDVVSFLSPPTPVVDVCYNFVLSRPISLDLSGYYPSNIQFQASAASGKAITYSASGLTGTGLSLSNVSANVVQLVGVPDTITPLSTVTVTASATGSPATASRTFKLIIQDDVITISDIPAASRDFIQNRTITPIQVSATTLSGRPVTSFSSLDLPTGLVVSSTGLITGTPEDSGSGTFSITASTGYSSQSRTYAYQTIPDNAVIVIPTTTNVVSMPTFSNAEFEILTYSGKAGSFSNIPLFPPTRTGAGLVEPAQAFDISLGWAGSNLVANFSSNPILAPEYRFLIQGSVGTFAQYTQVNLVVNSPPTVQHIAIAASDIVTASNTVSSPPIPTVTGTISVATDSPISFPSSNLVSPVASGPKVWSPTYSFSNIEGNGYDLARNSNVVIAVLGSNIIRSTDYGNTWTTIPSSNIQTLSYVYGPLYSGYPWADPNPNGYVRRRFANPVFGAIACDGTSNWWAIGEGSWDISSTFLTTSNVWAPMAVIRKSTDNGLTWTDVSATGYPLPSYSISTPFTGLLSFWMQKAKLAYNAGRLFYTGEPPAAFSFDISGLYIADVSDVSVWTPPSGASIGVATGIAFSNSVAVAVGKTDRLSSSNVSFISSNNGTSWTLESSVAGGTDVIQKYGVWGVLGYGFSRDLTSWTGGFGSGDAVTENGVTWLSGGSSGWRGQRWFYSPDPPYSNVPGSTDIITPTVDICASVYLKRLYADVTSNPATTATMFIPYDASGIAFTSPTQTQYTNWQFVPISTIDVTATNPVPGNFLYYYASGLPRGLTLTPDGAGVAATITGTPSQFSDAFQRVVLYAALSPGGGGGGVAALPLSMRTILPTVQKQQTSAGAWTSLVRQYTVVNAAENSINGRTLPATEPPLGEFTRPYPPDEVSVLPCPKC
jgi:hypothetical protein